MTTDDTGTRGVVGDIADQATATPAAVAVADAQEEWNYARVWRAAADTAAAIRTAGVGGKLVVVALRPSARWLAGLLGIWRRCRRRGPPAGPARRHRSLGDTLHRTANRAADCARR